MTDLSGRDVGRYHIIEKLGQGGMATVYRAYDTRLEREVALKVIRREAIGAEYADQLLKRFDREAKSLAALDHMHIVKVFDYGDFEGSPYLVMQYIPGGMLKAVTGKPIPYPRAARLLAKIARALEYAHRRGVIHRDIKPANILMNMEGEPMLSDFGIAKLLETSDATLTGTGVGIGTPEYMAPEQGMGHTIDHRADIYALGVVFYEMVTGRKPYTADTPMAVVLKQVTQPLPRPTSYNPDLPDAVEQVLFKALAKEPAERYDDMGKFANALDQLAAHAEPVTSPGLAQPETVAAPRKSTTSEMPTAAPGVPSTPSLASAASAASPVSEAQATSAIPLAATSASQKPPELENVATQVSSGPIQAGGVATQVSTGHILEEKPTQATQVDTSLKVTRVGAQGPATSATVVEPVAARPRKSKLPLILGIGAAVVVVVIVVIIAGVALLGGALKPTQVAEVPTTAPTWTPRPTDVPPAAAPIQKVTVTWLVRPGDADQNWEKNMVIPNFEKMNPGIKIDLLVVPQADYDAKMQAMLDSGNPVDIWSHWGNSGFMDYVRRGIVADLTPLIERDKYELGDFIPAALNASTVDGRVMGLPMVSTGTYLFYNKDLLDKAGVSYPPTNWDDTSWTWDAFLATCKALNTITLDPNGQFGCDVDLWPNDQIAWLWGQDLFPDSAYQTGFTDTAYLDSKPAIAAFQARQDIAWKYGYMPRPDQTNGLSSTDLLINWKIAMDMTGGWDWWLLSNVKGFRGGVAALPYGAPGRRDVIFTDPWMLSSKSAHPQEAWMFLKYLASPDVQKAQMEMTGISPARNGLLEEWYKRFPSMTPEQVKEVVMGSMKYGRESPHHLLVNYGLLNWKMQPAMDQIFNNKAKAAVALPDGNKALLDALKTIGAGSSQSGSSLKACLITDSGTVNDHSYNFMAWQGVQTGMAKFSIQGQYLESPNGQADYDKNFHAFLDQRCQLIIPVGFLFSDFTPKYAANYPDTHFATVDVTYDPPQPNVLGSHFAIEQAAFLNGYLAAGMTSTGMVGTYGGSNIPPVVAFMDGFARGVAYYNKVHNTQVQVIGWDVASQQGLFVDGFAPSKMAESMTMDLLGKGADIIFPVAGPGGLSSLKVLKSKATGMLIGVDSDWSQTYPDYAGFILSSVVKHMDTFTFDAIDMQMQGNFKGGTWEGNLANGGVGITYGSALQVKIPENLKNDILMLTADIINGKVKVK